MPSEAVLRMRIEDAVREAERANANHDDQAYARAAQKYYAADAWLTKLEQERNMKAIEELEAKARNGVLSYGRIYKAGIPFQAMYARGWVDLPDKSGMRKSDNPLGAQASETQSHDDTTEPDRKDAEHSPGDERA